MLVRLLFVILSSLLLLETTALAGAVVDTDFDTFETQVKDGTFKRHLDEDRKIVRITLEGNPFNLPDRVADALLILRHQGFAVEGGFLAGPIFEHAVENANEDNTPDGAMLIPLPPEDEMDRREFLRKGLKALTSRNPIQNFFGMPNGWAPIEEVRLWPRKKYLGILLAAEGIHNVILHKLLQKPSAPEEIKWVPHIILATYLYAYLSNMDEVMRQKSQGGTLRVDSREEFGRQISITPSYTWVTAQTGLEEFIINTALRMGIMGIGPALADTPRTIGDSAFNAFAKAFSEQIITGVYSLKADAKRRGDTAACARYETWAQILINGFYNGLFPVLKVMQLPGRDEATREMSNWIQGAMGVAGLGVQLYQSGRYRVDSGPPPNCSMLIEFAAKVEEEAPAPVQEIVVDVAPLREPVFTSQ